MSLKRVAIIFLTLISVAPLLAQVVDLKRNWKFHVGDNPAWAQPDYNDGNWEEIQVPARWEDLGFHGYDGFAWYRIRFDGRKLNPKDVYFLNMGYVDDTDEVFLNGRLIGFAGQPPPHFKTAWNSERRYTIPSDALNFSGENVIAVRVFDAMLSGGIADGNIGIHVLEHNTKFLLDLQGIWQFTAGRRNDKLKEHQWRNMIVPSPWDYHGYLKYDGYGWYKRTFTLSSIPPNEEIVLVLGKIDDFDKTYLNGELIGQTNDMKPFGESTSYQQQRVYTIPRQLLKRDEPNIIEVQVQDIGIVGGMYEGRVGITTRSNYERHFRN